MSGPKYYTCSIKESTHIIKLIISKKLQLLYKTTKAYGDLGHIFHRLKLRGLSGRKKFSILLGDPFQCHLMPGLMHLIERNNYILRRKSLVSTDTVCNNFVRQS